MRQKIFTYVIIGILTLLTSGCEKNEIDSDSKVELYLLDSYSKVDDSFQIDETTIKTKISPLIGYTDFISYDAENYEFEISDKGKSAIDSIEYPVHGVAFAIKANGTIIYSGYFWPGYSSVSCDWIVIDPTMMTSSFENKIKVNLGFPGLIKGQVISDKRNDNRIIEIFERDNKLIK